ncbi:hypothetical protein V6N11_035522 [Hibiscus sabdariffa]|uniref:RNase H type-1 domain-containing protein n=1 Tax=Hibiscus sabdariffa TaxID=183260 RepID=A0ABR2R0Z7_9ROSI
MYSWTTQKLEWYGDNSFMVQLEFDCREVVCLVMKSDQTRMGNALVMVIHDLMHHNWEVSMTHICRPANVVADCLASLMCDKLLQEVAFENPPTAARGLLLNDLPSVSI